MTRAAGRPAPSRAPVRVKICGVCTPVDARAAVAAGADMIGLNFFRGSRRFVGLERGAAIAAEVPRSVWRVGVFVDASRDEIDRVRRELDLSAIQLHGEEPAELLRGWPVPVIRAVRLSSESEARSASRTLVADYVLVEGRAEGAFGGAGARFPWQWAEAFPAARLFVAGGLTPDNVAGAVRALRPFAVDVASGVESSPGVKEPARVAAFVEHAKAA